MQDFNNLLVWQKAHALTLEIYRDSRNYPREELYGLTSQIRRASSSIGANIAEGCGLGTDPLLRRSLTVAMGSASELQYHLLLARDLGFVAGDVYDTRLAALIEVKKMLAAFIKRLRTG
jgi:four helix bundle protein